MYQLSQLILNHKTAKLTLKEKIKKKENPKKQIDHYNLINSIN